MLYRAPAVPQPSGRERKVGARVGPSLLGYRGFYFINPPFPAWARQEQQEEFSSGGHMRWNIPLSSPLAHSDKISPSTPLLLRQRETRAHPGLLSRRFRWAPIPLPVRRIAGRCRFRCQGEGPHRATGGAGSDRQRHCDPVGCGSAAATAIARAVRWVWTRARPCSAEAGLYWAGVRQGRSRIEEAKRRRLSRQGR